MAMPVRRDPSSSVVEPKAASLLQAAAARLPALEVCPSCGGRDGRCDNRNPHLTVRRPPPGPDEVLARLARHFASSDYQASEPLDMVMRRWVLSPPNLLFDDGKRILGEAAASGLAAGEREAAAAAGSEPSPAPTPPATPTPPPSPSLPASSNDPDWLAVREQFLAVGFSEHMARCEAWRAVADRIEVTLAEGRPAELVRVYEVLRHDGFSPQEAALLALETREERR